MRRKDFLRLTTTALAGTAIAPRWARAALSDVHPQTWQLPSGLRVLCLPRRGFPLATVGVFYQVGSKHEKPGVRGVARMLEGLLWKGSPRVPADVHARFIRQVGGTVGGFATEDVTAVHQTVPPDYIEFALELEADRLRGLMLFESLVMARRQELLEERIMRVDQNPAARALELFRENAFGAHPYAWTTAGLTHELRTLGVDACRSFHEQNFHPSRATVVVAGDLTVDQVRTLVDKHMGAHASPGSTKPEGAARPFTPPEKGFEKHLRVPLPVPMAVVGFHTPPSRHADELPLQVLAEVAAGGVLGLAHRSLVFNLEIATLASGAARSLADAGLFATFAVGKPNQDPRALAAALRTVMANILSGPEAATRVESARKRVLARLLRETYSLEGLTTRLAMSELVAGNANLYNQRLATLRTLNVEKLSRVMKRYVVADRALVLTLEPERTASP